MSFRKLVCLKNFKLKLCMDPLVTPVQQPIRRIPYHTKEKVSSELKRLLELDIIEKKHEPSCTSKTSCTSTKIQ